MRRSRSTPELKVNDRLEERVMGNIKVEDTAFAEEATVGRIDSSARIKTLEARLDVFEADANAKNAMLNQFKLDLDDSTERLGEQIEVLFETFRRIETDLKTATAALAALRAGTERQSTGSKTLVASQKLATPQAATATQLTFELKIPPMPFSQARVVMLDTQRKQITAVLAKPGETVVFEAQPGQTRWFQMFVNGQLQDEFQMTA
jgi:hypothetical protein